MTMCDDGAKPLQKLSSGTATGVTFLLLLLLMMMGMMILVTMPGG